MAELSAIKFRTSLMWPAFRQTLLDDPAWIVIPADSIVDGRALVIEARGEIAGFAILEPRGDGDCEFHDIFVDPGHWGSPAPRRLIEAVVAMAAARGAWTVWAVTSPEAAAFYEASGFETEVAAAPLSGPALRLRRDIRSGFGRA
jgi:GNAT superfamily N-acetyltransferase